MRSSKWDDRRPTIQRMVIEGKSDAEIGLVYDVTGATICKLRKRFRIASNFKHAVKGAKVTATPVPPEPPLVGITYVDEVGLTVTRYPARYAIGGGLQPFTARPKRG